MIPTYDFKTHSRTSTVREVQPAKIVIVEGILLLAVPEIRELLDMKIFVEAEDDIRILRRLERDLLERGRDFQSVKDQYMKTVKPMHNLFVHPSRSFADVIIPSVGDTKESEKIILSRLHAFLSESL